MVITVYKSHENIFSTRLISLRKEKGLSQYSLADKLGCSRGLISNYEQGRREPDFNTLLKLADYFNVSTDYLLGKSNIASTSDLLNRIGPPDDVFDIYKYALDVLGIDHKYFENAPIEAQLIFLQAFLEDLDISTGSCHLTLKKTESICDTLRFKSPYLNEILNISDISDEQLTLIMDVIKNFKNRNS